MLPKLRVLFLCTANSCRSQMAEGWARHVWGAAIEPYSAGAEPGTLDRQAVRVMAEAGVDISRQRPKHRDALADVGFDYVVTLCDTARESCPVFPGAGRRLHAAFDDPLRLAAACRTEDEALEPYRRVRDEIRAFVEKLPMSRHGAR